MKNMLKELQGFVNKMKNTSSLNEKKVIIDSIKDNKFITKALNYALDPYKKYYVTSKTCKKTIEHAEFITLLQKDPHHSKSRDPVGVKFFELNRSE